VDNIFPHHENEIAQSEGATGHPFVKYWMHAAHLMVDGEKMAKSKGNFHTLRDLVAQGHDPRALRYLLLMTHYRSTLNFTFDGLARAASELARLDALAARLDAEPLPEGADPGFDEKVGAFAVEFKDALTDDLNVSGAQGALFRLVREANAALDRRELPQGSAPALRSGLQGADRVLGVLARSARSSPPRSKPRSPGAPPREPRETSPPRTASGRSSWIRGSCWRTPRRGCAGAAPPVPSEGLNPRRRRPSNRRETVSRDVPDFDEIVRAHRQMVYRVALRIVRTHEEADEVAQETFVRAWRALPGSGARLAVRLAGPDRDPRARERRRVPWPWSAGARRSAFVDRPRGRAACGAAHGPRRLRTAVRSLPTASARGRGPEGLLRHDVRGRRVGARLTVGAVKAHLHQAVGNLRRRLRGGRGMSALDCAGFEPRLAEALAAPGPCDPRRRPRSCAPRGRVPPAGGASTSWISSRSPRTRAIRSPSRRRRTGRGFEGISRRASPPRSGRTRAAARRGAAAAAAVVVAPPGASCFGGPLSDRKPSAASRRGRSAPSPDDSARSVPRGGALGFSDEDDPSLFPGGGRPDAGGEERLLEWLERERERARRRCGVTSRTDWVRSR
jgi:hypothetical protein